jgi:hypothetical protein
VGNRIDTFSILTYLFIMHLDCSALTPALSLREREQGIRVRVKRF